MNLEDGEVVTDPQDIADVFAAFYENLYRRRGSTESWGMPSTAEQQPIPHVTKREIQKQLRKMMKRKAGDTHGV
eukprot:11654495-Karenia_brevis.AAC.1